MLLLHRTFIRLALAFLILGVGAGVVLELGRSWGDGGWLVPVTLHVHLLAVGFLLNMVMGVAHWMFPRLPGTTARDAERDPLGWANLLTLNGGLLLRIPGEMLPSPNVRVLAAVLQALGVAFFVAAIWKRVRFPKVAASR